MCWQVHSRENRCVRLSTPHSYRVTLTSANCGRQEENTQQLSFTYFFFLFRVALDRSSSEQLAPYTASSMATYESLSQRARAHHHHHHHHHYYRYVRFRGSARWRCLLVSNDFCFPTSFACSPPLVTLEDHDRVGVLNSLRCYQTDRACDRANTIC